MTLKHTQAISNDVYRLATPPSLMFALKLEAAENAKHVNVASCLEIKMDHSVSTVFESWLNVH
jgi:hypothetical protein